MLTINDLAAFKAAGGGGRRYSRRRRGVSKYQKTTIRKAHAKYMRKKESSRIKNQFGKYLEGKISKYLSLNGLKGAIAQNTQEELDKICEIALLRVAQRELEKPLLQHQV